MPPEPVDARLWELQDDDDDNDNDHDDDDDEEDEVGEDAEERPNGEKVNHCCRNAIEVSIFSLNGALIQDSNARLFNC